MAMPNDAPSAPSSRPTAKLPPRLGKLVEEYGTVALVVFVCFSLLNWTAALTAIFVGVDLDTLARAASKVAGTFGMTFDPKGALSETAGFFAKLGAAWALTRVTLPIRIGLTVLLTPFVARAYEAVKRRRAARGK